MPPPAPVLPAPAVVIWQDVECGAYRADLPLWEALAGEVAPPARILDYRHPESARTRILEVGAGVGRVALPLAHVGHGVTALDRDPELLAELGRRADAAGVQVGRVEADAADFALTGPAFALVLVPMQTIQLLPDAAARTGFLASARRHLAPGGLVAMAIADALEGFDAEVGVLPAPDVGERDGWRFASQPVAVRELPDAARIERIRQALGPSGERVLCDDVIELRRVSVGELEAAGRAAGLSPEPTRWIAPTEEHVGSRVVLLRG